jgi:hypothetical protein
MAWTAAISLAYAILYALVDGLAAYFAAVVIALLLIPAIGAELRGRRGP